MLPSRQCAAGDAGPVGHLLLREAGVHARGFEGQFRGGTSSSCKERIHHFRRMQSFVVHFDECHE